MQPVSFSRSDFSMSHSASIVGDQMTRAIALEPTIGIDANRLRGNSFSDSEIVLQPIQQMSGAVIDNAAASEILRCGLRNTRRDRLHAELMRTLREA